MQQKVGFYLWFTPAKDHDNSQGYKLYLSREGKFTSYHLGKPQVTNQGRCWVDLSILPGIKSWAGLCICGITELAQNCRETILHRFQIEVAQISRCQPLSEIDVDFSDEKNVIDTPHCVVRSYNVAAL